MKHVSVKAHTFSETIVGDVWWTTPMVVLAAKHVPSGINEAYGRRIPEVEKAWDALAEKSLKAPLSYEDSSKLLKEQELYARSITNTDQDSRHPS